MAQVPDHRIKKIICSAVIDSAFIGSDLEAEKQALKIIGLEIAEKLFEFNKVAKEINGNLTLYKVGFSIIVPETPVENLKEK